MGRGLAGRLPFDVQGVGVAVVDTSVTPVAAERGFTNGWFVWLKPVLLVLSFFGNVILTKKVLKKNGPGQGVM